MRKRFIRKLTACILTGVLFSTSIPANGTDFVTDGSSDTELFSEVSNTNNADVDIPSVVPEENLLTDLPAEQAALEAAEEIAAGQEEGYEETSGGEPIILPEEYSITGGDLDADEPEIAVDPFAVPEPATALYCTNADDAADDEPVIAVEIERGEAFPDGADAEVSLMDKEAEAEMLAYVNNAFYLDGQESEGSLLPVLSFFVNITDADGDPVIYGPAAMKLYLDESIAIPGSRLFCVYDDGTAKELPYTVTGADEDTCVEFTSDSCRAFLFVKENETSVLVVGEDTAPAADGEHTIFLSASEEGDTHNNTIEEALEVTADTDAEDDFASSTDSEASGSASENAENPAAFDEEGAPGDVPYLLPEENISDINNDADSFADGVDLPDATDAGVEEGIPEDAESLTAEEDGAVVEESTRLNTLHCSNEEERTANGTDISVRAEIYAENGFPEGTWAQIHILHDGELDNVLNALANAFRENEETAAEITSVLPFSISLKDESGNDVSINDTLTINVYLEEIDVINDVVLYRADADGSVTDIPYTVTDEEDGQPFVSFVTEGVSSFIFAKDAEDPESLLNETAYMTGELTYSGDDYTVRLDVTEEAQIPEGSEITAEELLPGTPEYDEYIYPLSPTRCMKTPQTSHTPDSLTLQFCLRKARRSNPRRLSPYPLQQKTKSRMPTTLKRQPSISKSRKATVLLKRRKSKSNHLLTKHRIP